MTIRVVAEAGQTVGASIPVAIDTAHHLTSLLEGL